MGLGYWSPINNKISLTSCNFPLMAAIVTLAVSKVQGFYDTTEIGCIRLINGERYHSRSPLE